MFVGAYWGARKETRLEASGRIARFLDRLLPIDASLGTWFKQGKTRAEASVPIGDIAIHLQETRNMKKEPIQDLGFSLGIWNGNNSSILATVGVWSPYVINSVVLQFTTNQSPDAMALKDMLVAAIDVFEPEHGVVTDHAYLKSHHLKKPWDAGLFTYDPIAGIIAHPEATA